MKMYAKRIHGGFGKYNEGDVFELDPTHPKGLRDMEGYYHSRENVERMPMGYSPECATAAEVSNSSVPYVMSKDELFALHASTTAACLEVMKKKNHDYTSGGSVFANFKDSSILGIPPVMGVLLRCIDKFKRIQTHCTKGKLVVEGEGVLDAVDDVINYMILAKGMLIEESKNR